MYLSLFETGNFAGENQLVVVVMMAVVAIPPNNRVDGCQVSDLFFVWRFPNVVKKQKRQNDKTSKRIKTGKNCAQWLPGTW